MKGSGASPRGNWINDILSTPTARRLPELPALAVAKRTTPARAHPK